MTEDSRMFGRLATHTGRVTMPGTVRGGTTIEPPDRVPAAGYERHVTWRHWCFR